MKEGQQPGVASRARSDDVFVGALASVPHIPDTTAKQPENRAWPGYLTGISATRKWLRTIHWHANLQRAVAEELAFGHSFLFVPVLLGLGALVWFGLPYTPGHFKLALLICVFGMAAFVLRHRSGLLRTGTLIAAL